jgi:MFS family permease
MSGSSGMVGIVTFAAMAPRFIIPPIAGYLADRFDRKTVLATVYWINTGTTVLLAGLAFADVLELWHLMTLSVMNGTARTFQMTSTAALVPNLVPRDRMLNAVSLNAATQQGSRLFGPGLIAPLLIFYGTDAAFLLSAGFYALGLIMVSRIQTRSTGNIGPGTNMLASLGAAAVVVYQNPKLRVLFIVVALHCSMTMSFESMLPIFSRDVLGSGSVGVSYLMMSVGAGGLASALFIAGVQEDRMRGRLLLVAGVLSGLSMLALAASPNIVLASLSAAVMGASQAAFMTLLAAMVQMMAPDEMRGRISGLNQINIGGTMAMVNLGNGFIADAVGSSAVLTTLGIGFVVVMLLSLLVTTLRNVYVGGVPTPAPAA